MNSLIKEEVNKKIIGFLIYLLLFIFFICKVNFYQEHVGRFPDENTHITYISYLETKNVVIPNFTDIPANLSTVEEDGDIFVGEFTSEGFNYLGHSPLYYNIMRLANGIKIIDGKVIYDINILRDFSQKIVFISMILAFYIGLSRIKKNYLHLLYGVIITSIPMMAYVSAGVNNDALAFLGVTISLIGFIRFEEEKYNITSYLVLSFGIMIALLAKLTSGLIITISFLIFFGIKIFKEKSLNIFMNKRFYATIPIYLIPVIYYVFTYIRYGTFQPGLSSISFDYFKTTGFYVPIEERKYMTFFDYYKHYTKNFVLTWTGIASHVSLLKSGKYLDRNSIALFSVLWLPLLGFINKSKKNVKLAYTCVYFGALISMLFQFLRAYKNFQNYGYLGSYQSRYYLCALPAFAFLICIAIYDRYNFAYKYYKNQTGNGILVDIGFGLICLTYSITLIYQDFIYFILNFNKYI